MDNEIEQLIAAPLFAFDDNSLSIFDSVHRLLRKLEPIDVQNNIYQVFDANGSIVKLSMVYQKKTFFKICKVTVPTVVVDNILACQQNILFEKLKKSMDALHDKSDISNMDLNALQQHLIHLYGLTI